MFPAALAIVVQTFELRERGRALALFFGIAGGLTAIGPILGGVLTQWTWRAIFWVNIPVALIALALIALARPRTVYEPARADYRGLVLIAGGVALSVFGFQQSSLWGWSNRASGPASQAGSRSSLLSGRRDAHFVTPDEDQHLQDPRLPGRESRARDRDARLHPGLLLRQRIRTDRPREESLAGGNRAALLLPRLRRRRAARGTDARPRRAKRPVVLGCALAAVGFYLWAGELTKLDFNSQRWYIVLSGAGMGFMLGPATTDAVNRASRLSYGEATGITQTVRNFSASLGLAILGTILVDATRSHLTTSLTAQGLSPAAARATASRLAQSQGKTSAAAIPHFVRVDFAAASHTVFLSMAGVMAVAAVVALAGLRRGVQADPDTGQAASG